MKVSENWLREYISIDKPLSEIANALTMSGLEVKNFQPNKELRDVVCEVEITSNRPDWLSYVGIAREIGALFGKKIILPKMPQVKKRKQVKNFKIEILSKELCPFYSGVIVRGVSICDSPKELQKKLLAIGSSPINLIVDLTNIVLFELGQPMHAFDLAKLKGGKIIVRKAKKGELFRALNDEEYRLTVKDLIIADTSGPVALAGVMGGKGSEVSDETTDILLESAYFDPASVRTTSRRHQLVSDSSYRFERKVDMEMIRKAQDRFIYLLEKYGRYNSISQVLTAGGERKGKRSISFDHRQIQQILGFSIPRSKVHSILKHLGMKVIEKGKASQKIQVEVPSFRPDLLGEIDLIEEVTRIYGFDKVPETLPPRIVQSTNLEKPSRGIKEIIHKVCLSSGCFEVVPFNLINERKITGIISNTDKFVRIVNPQNKDLQLMRPSLIPGILEVVRHNIHTNNADLRFYETGNIYRKSVKKGLPDEIERAAILLTGGTSRLWHTSPKKYDIYDLKGILENLLSELHISFSLKPHAYDYFNEDCSIGIEVKGKILGTFGIVKDQLLRQFEIKQEVLAAEIGIEALEKHSRLKRQFQELSRYPAVKRDIAIIVDEAVLVKELETEILSISRGLVKKIDLFDNFRGKHLPPGKKNVAFLMEFSSKERTLSGEEIQEVYEDIFANLNRKFQAVFKEG